MTAVEHTTPELLRVAADRIEQEHGERAGLADVRRHIRYYLRTFNDLGTLAADDMRRVALSDLEAWQLRKPTPGSVDELVDQLRAAAAWREQLDGQEHLAELVDGGAA